MLHRQLFLLSKLQVEAHLLQSDLQWNQQVAAMSQTQVTLNISQTYSSAN